MKTRDDYYEEALDAIRDAQGDQWVAYSADDIKAAEKQADRMTEKKAWSIIYERIIDTDEFRYDVRVFGDKSFQIIQAHIAPGWVGDGYIRSNILLTPKDQVELLPAIAEAIEAAEKQANHMTDTKIAKITLPVVHRKWLPLLHICLDELRGDHTIDEMAEFIVLFEDAVIELAEFVSEKDRDDHNRH